MVELAIQYSAGQSIWWHPYHMSEPAQLVLGDRGLNTPAVGLRKDFSLRHTITPGDTKDALQASNMEALQGPDVTAVRGPCFTAVEEGGDADSLVNRNLSVQMEVVVLEDPSP